MKKEYKNIFDKIAPDDEIKEKVIASAKSRHKISFNPVKIGALVAVFAIVVTAGGLGIKHNGESVGLVDTSSSESTQLSPLDFSIVAYAKENPSEKVELSENSIGFIDYKIDFAGYDDDGGATVSASGATGFSINAEDIESVTFSSQIGEFRYFDSLKEKKLINDQEFYVEIPLTDEENQLYHKKYEGNENEFLEYIVQSKDCTRYFKGNSTNLDDYSSVYYSDKDDYGNENQLLLVKESLYDELNVHGKTITAKTYMPDDKIDYVYYNATDATEILLKNPDTKFEDLPEDNIKITVKFKSGQSVTKELLGKFDSEGIFTLQYK